jgi:CUE domain
MSISYEEALATLQAMFPEPWTRDSLDAVLRFEKGHMENTCERIMQHGDADPQLLVDRLKAGGPEPQVAMDEELARQLASGGGRSNTSGNGPTGTGDTAGSALTKKGRGTPTTLPDDFLRIPGYKRSVASAANATANGAAAMDDETLARMLQDELFSEELARNPQFAHLATGRSSAGRSRGGQSANGGSNRVSVSNARIPAAPNGPNPFEGVNMVQKISGTPFPAIMQTV